ncbi:hypothetical protein [Rhizobium sp. ZX09]|nr:hypothetical protein [Rhizobium sp. ZX09]
MFDSAVGYCLACETLEATARENLFRVTTKVFLETLQNAWAGSNDYDIMR